MLARALARHHHCRHLRKPIAHSAHRRRAPLIEIILPPSSTCPVMLPVDVVGPAVGSGGCGIRPGGRSRDRDLDRDLPLLSKLAPSSLRRPPAEPTAGAGRPRPWSLRSPGRPSVWRSPLWVAAAADAAATADAPRAVAILTAFATSLSHVIAPISVRMRNAFHALAACWPNRAASLLTSSIVATTPGDREPCCGGRGGSANAGPTAAARCGGRPESASRGRAPRACSVAQPPAVGDGSLGDAAGAPRASGSPR